MPSSTLTRRSTPPPNAGRSRARAVRWIAVLVAVLGLHWIAAQWVERHRQTFEPIEAAHAPVEIALLKPERIAQQPAAEPHAAPKPAPAPARAPSRAPREHVLTATRPEPTAPAVPDAASAPQAASASAGTAASGVANTAASATANASAPAAASAPRAASGVKFSVPPSGDMQYDTFYNGVRASARSCPSLVPLKACP